MMNKFVIIFSALLITSTTLTGCGSSSSSSPQDLTKLTLFVTDDTNLHVHVIDNASIADGVITPDQDITGALTSLSNPCDIAYDNNKEIIYIADWNNGVIAFDNSGSPTGNAAPDRLISGAMPGFQRTCGVEIDNINNRLYIGGDHGLSIYDSANTVDGNIAPDRLVTGPLTLLSGGGELRPFLDKTNNRMYLADPNSTQVLIFNNASTIDGDIAPDRVISGNNTAFDYPWGISVDLTRNKLYIGDSTSDAIFIFDDASTVNGNIAPSRIISGPNTGLMNQEVTEVYIDEKQDTIYAVLRTSGTILAWNNASTINGDMVPDKTISGANTTLIGTNGIVGIYR